MSLTFSVVDRQDFGQSELVILDITFDNTYAFGGEPVSADDLGFRLNSKLFLVMGCDGKYYLEFVPDPALSSRATRGNRGNLLLREIMPPSQDSMLGAPGLTIGTVSAKEIKLANATLFLGAGATPAELAAQEKGFTATTHDITADASTAQEAWYLLSTTDGAAIVITKGTTADEGSAVPPAVPSNAAPIGLVKIVVAAGTTPADDFDATTDDLDASHLTVTYYDLDRQVYQGTDLSGLTMRVLAFGR